MNAQSVWFETADRARLDKTRIPHFRIAARVMILDAGTSSLKNMSTIRRPASWGQDIAGGASTAEIAAISRQRPTAPVIPHHAYVPIAVEKAQGRSHSQPMAALRDMQSFPLHFKAKRSLMTFCRLGSLRICQNNTVKPDPTIDLEVSRFSTMGPPPEEPQLPVRSASWPPPI